MYNEYMGSITQFGGITRSGSPGSYGYAARPGFESKPVVFVSFWDAMRLANWLHNGQPTGLQTAATTEGGAYTLTPAAIAANSVPRNVGARVFLPSDDEWYKAAYYDPIAGVYYDYPVGANAISGCVSPGSDTGNSANCNNAVGALTDVGAYALSMRATGTSSMPLAKAPRSAFVSRASSPSPRPASWFCRASAAWQSATDAASSEMPRSEAAAVWPVLTNVVNRHIACRDATEHRPRRPARGSPPAPPGVSGRRAAGCATENPGLQHLWGIHPGPDRYPLADRITALPLRELPGLELGRTYVVPAARGG